MESTQPQREQLAENDIRVSFKTDIFRAVERVEKAFETHDTVKFSAINSGISKLIVIIEITKVKLEGLHQINIVETLTNKTTQDGEERNRYMTAFRVELSKNKPSNIPAGYFYQAPYTKEHVEAIKSVKPKADENRERTPFRGRGRGGRGGRGRGQRGGRGSSRGGFQGEGRVGYQGEGRVGYQGEGRGGYQGEGRGGYQGEGRGGYQGEGRGGYQGEGRGRGSRGGRGRGGRGRGGFQGETREEGNFRGGRGSRGSRGGRGGNSRGGRGGNDVPQDRPQTAAPAQKSTIPGLPQRR